MSALDRIEQRARERGGEGLGGFVALGVPDVLALVNIARAAHELVAHEDVDLIVGGGWFNEHKTKLDALRAALSVVGETSGGEDGA